MFFIFRLFRISDCLILVLNYFSQLKIVNSVSFFPNYIVFFFFYTKRESDKKTKQNGSLYQKKKKKEISKY